MSKRPNQLSVGGEPKKSKRVEPPWTRGPSTWTRTDSTIMQPFLGVRSMTERDVNYNKYVGGKVDFDLLHNLLFHYLLPLLDVTQESLGGKPGELNSRLSFVALPIMIRVLCKKERGPEPIALPKTQADRIEEAAKLLHELPSKILCSDDLAVGPLSEWCNKVKKLGEDLSKIVQIRDSSLEEEDEEIDGDLEYGPYKTAGDRKDEQNMQEETEQASKEAGPSSTGEIATPKEQMLAPVDPDGGSSAQSSPDSQYDPEFVHELHMGQWSVDLGLKIRDKRCPRMKLIKNLMDGKGAATIIVTDEMVGALNQLIAYSCWHLLINAAEGRYSSIYSQLYNVQKYLAAEAVLTTIIKLDESGQITAQALKEAQDLQREVWKQQHPAEPFNESCLVTMAALKAQLQEAERLLRVIFDLPKDEARLPGGKYVVGEFFRNERLHGFLSLPLEHEPGASTWAFLEAQLLIGLGDRVIKWRWDDVKSRLEGDLERRRVRQAKILRTMNVDAWRKMWKEQGQAKSVNDLVWPKDVLM